MMMRKIQKQLNTKKATQKISVWPLRQQNNRIETVIQQITYFRGLNFLCLLTMFSTYTYMRFKNLFHGFFSTIFINLTRTKTLFTQIVNTLSS